MMNYLPLFVALPLGAAFILPVLGKLKVRRLADTVAVLVAGCLLALSVWIVLGGATGAVWIGGWQPGEGPLGINLYADGLTRLMLLTMSLVGFVAVLYSVQYMDRFTGKGLYYSLFFLMVAGMNGVVMTGDLFNLYVFLEVAAIASYALVAFGCESEELEASFKYLVLGVVGSTFALFGIGMCYNQVGSLNMADIGQFVAANGVNPVLLFAASLFFAGFGLKAAMVPFHAWLPDAHPSAPAPISAMLSGVLIKALGVYVLCRIFFNVLGPAGGVFPTVLMTMGAVSMIVGVLLAVGQWDFKRLLAYHSISQMGYVVLAIGLAGTLLAKAAGAESSERMALETTAGLAMFGGLFHMFNHAVFKSLLFLCAGAAEYATGTRELKQLGGLVKKMPITSTCCRIAALSISGVPPFNGFWSKLIIILALAQAGYYWLAGLTVLVSFLTLLSFVKVQRYVLQGELKPENANVREVPVWMCAAMIILATVCVGAGLLFPVIKGQLFAPAGEALRETLGYAQAVLGG
ncbi:MAG: complex I subunit 5 family protein [Alphaproteobacteria bacterium]